jgi:DUF917 family protein
MKMVSVDDLHCLKIGSAILGSGGGGDPGNEMLIAQHAIECYGSVPLLDPDELTSEDWVLPVAMMGAPLAGLEKLPSGREFICMVEMIAQVCGKRPGVLMPAEIGGGNGFVALSIAKKLGMAVLDADLIGRAFPKLQMTSCTVHNLSFSPVFLADSLGNTVMIEGKDAYTLEHIARHVTVSMGSICAVGLCQMPGDMARQVVIPRTTTRAIELGRAMLRAKGEGKDVVEALLEEADGVRLAEGVITTVTQSIKNGFLEGDVTLAAEEGTVQLLYQNEYLLALKNGDVLASTPDILMLLEKESASPVTSESLRYGLKVVLVAIPAPAIWQSRRGLELVGPQCFGFSFPYKPVRRER